MVMPSWLSRPFVAGCLATACLAPAGCGLVPQGRLDECQKLTRTLRSENSRLKDQTLGLRAQNQELSLRAVDDSRRLRAQDEAIERLEQSVMAYQSEREQLARDFERIKGQLGMLKTPGQASSAEAPEGLATRLQALARRQPGAEYDVGSATLVLPLSSLFEPGNDRLEPEAKAWLEELAGLLTRTEVGDLGLRVSGAPQDPSVRRAGLGADPQAHSRFLSMARGARVRDFLAKTAGLDPSRTVLAAGEALPDDDGAAGKSGARLEIRVEPRGPAAAGLPARLEKSEAPAGRSGP